MASADELRQKLDAGIDMVDDHKTMATCMIAQTLIEMLAQMERQTEALETQTLVMERNQGRG